MKRHLFTRLLSLLLVVAMVAGFAMPAFAADGHDHGTEVIVESEAPAVDDAGESLSFERLDESVSPDFLNEAEDTEKAALYEDWDISSM
ncbi:MAG: hypothetical protein IJ357_04405 [Oscillospiraceae bacterium]|nr:hypothetical protein [Oscillospiraceae bacterium]